MPDTLDLGGMKIQKKTAGMVGGGLVIVLGVAWYRSKQQAASAAAATAQAGQNGIDPATGYQYGSAEDQAALSQQSGYIMPADSSSFTGGQVIGYDSMGNPVYGPTSGLGGVPGTPGAFTSNAAWAQYAEQYMVGTENADAATVGNALGKYITGQPLDPTTMVPLVQSAIAIAGYPPVSGSNGNPPGYITANVPVNGGTGGGTPPPNNQIIVPNITGMRLADATGALTAVGLRIAGAKQTKGVAEVVVSQNPKAGTSVNPGSTITVTIKKA